MKTTPQQQEQVISKPDLITRDEHGIDTRQLCSSATEVVASLQQAGYEAYIVGGSVRDLLLGERPKDFDVATDATPEEVKAVFPRCRLIGRRFRLAHVRMRGALLEVATFRGQGGQAPGHQDDDGRILRDNVWGSVEEDAVRRDFTINALFMDPVNGEIRDYVGGFRDLQQRSLRLIGDPEIRYREDPVRLLRAARFAAKLGVTLEPATAAPMAAVEPRLEQIPPARLFEEVCKLFLTGHAGRTVDALQQFGLMRYLFPVLPAGDDVGVARLHPVVQRATESTDRRIAEGKSVTPAFLIAAVLWEPLLERIAPLEAAGMPAYQAMEEAADALLAEQLQRTAIPRRFSAVTRQIWLNQLRLKRTRGARALTVMSQPRFRAAYDFLLIRALDEPELQELADFWTQAQQERPDLVETAAPTKRRRRRRGGRGRGRKRPEGVNPGPDT